MLFRWPILLVLLEWLCSIYCNASPSPMLINDWYFRETLPAIRNWEAILGQWEKHTPAQDRTPIFPVPIEGSKILWPNPFPALLIPFNESKHQLYLRLTTNNAVEVIQCLNPEKTTVTSTKIGKTIVGYQHPGGGAKLWNAIFKN